MPRTLDEIARLCELTVRQLGKETDCARDLDVFDGRYHHLVLYDAENQCVVGAYRLTFCDNATMAHGFEGLFSNCVGALVFVDLDDAPENILRRFLGDVRFAEYRDYGVPRR